MEQKGFVYAPSAWICEWCEYMNDPSRKTCEVCNEQSAVRNATMCNDIVRIVANPNPMPATSAALTTLVAPISEIPPLIAETKTFQPAAMVVTQSSQPDDHMCFRDADSIYCLICQTPMFFVFANKLKYPRDFPNKLLEKVALLEKSLTEDMYKKIIIELNGGAIPGAEKHVMYSTTQPSMHISTLLTNISSMDDPMRIDMAIGGENVTYSGPSREGLTSIFNAAVTRGRPMILQIVIANTEIDDREDMFIAICSNGDTYMLNPTLSPCSYPIVETFLKSGFNGVKNELNKDTIYFIPHVTWNRICARQSPTYIDFTKSPMWKLVMDLVLMSMISIGLSIKEAVAILVSQDKQTMSLLLDSALDRLVAFVAHRESIDSTMVDV